MLNNNKYITHIAGLIARNINLDNRITVNLIITEVIGKNKTNINDIVEVARQKADLFMANGNGIYVNGRDFKYGQNNMITGKFEIKERDFQ